MICCIHSYIVTGPVDPETLGLVLPHEHLLIDYQKICQPLPNGRCDDIQSLKLCNIGAVYYHPYVQVIEQYTYNHYITMCIMRL